MIRLRTMISTGNRSVLAVAALALISATVVFAHSAPMAHEMHGGDGKMSDSVSICLAILQVAGLTVSGILAAFGFNRRRRYRLRSRRTLPLPVRIDSLAISPGSRASPEFLQVFRH